MTHAIVWLVTAPAWIVIGYTWGRIRHERWMRDRWNEIVHFEEKNLRPLTTQEVIAVFGKDFGG